MSLAALRADWSACTRCRLAEGRRSVVYGEPYQAAPGEGDPLVLVIGEAPGEREDQSGRPFVGPAGEVLRGLLREAGCRFAFITNLLACRPPGNRDPRADEIEACRPRLLALIEALAPAGVLLVGRVAEGQREALALGARPVAAVVHPAWLLRKGYPGKATEATWRLQVGRLRRLLAQAGAPEVPPPSDAAACRHRYVEAGAWVGERGRRPLRLCAECGLLEAACAR